MRPELDRLITWIRESAADAHGLLVPVSGGTDGALCLWLCAQAFPGKTFAVHAGRDLRERAWFEAVAPVTYLDAPTGPAREELRWASFLAESRARDLWLVGTRNRTEDLLGSFSLASRVAAYLPIVGVWKSDVLMFSKEIGVPDAVIASSSEPDPDCGRPADLAAIPYAQVEAFLQRRLENGEDPIPGLTAEQELYLDHTYRAWSFRTRLPTIGPMV